MSIIGTRKKGKELERVLRVPDMLLQGLREVPEPQLCY